MKIVITEIFLIATVVTMLHLGFGWIDRGWGIHPIIAFPIATVCTICFMLLILVVCVALESDEDKASLMSMDEDLNKGLLKGN